MEQVSLQQDALVQDPLEQARQNMLNYFQTHDMQYVAEDAVFKILNTGQTFTGRAEIGAALHWFYQIVFDSSPQLVSFAITENKAVVEARLKAKHIGDFNGIPATNKEVDFPLCVNYEHENGIVKEARIYLLLDVLYQQLGVTPGGTAKKTGYVVRDIFQLKYGHFREAKALLEEASANKLLPENDHPQVLSDFTGDAYRLVFEESFDNLADYEISLNSSMRTEEWQAWYGKFKEHVVGSHREILKKIL